MIDWVQDSLPSVFDFVCVRTLNKSHIFYRADPHSVVQFPIQVEILASLTRLLLAPSSPYTLDVSITSAVHFGHSYGSYITAALASAYPELTQVCLLNLTFSGKNSVHPIYIIQQAISLSGYSGVFDFFNILIAGWQSRVAALLDSARWGHLQTGYVTPVDIYADAYLEFKSPYFDHTVAEWASSVKSPYAVGELATLGQRPYDTSNFNKPVQVDIAILILRQNRSLTCFHKGVPRTL
jgi:pimeloyl-ACP methyl ester carboxylesterase